MIMLNRKPVGPCVVLYIFYDGNKVYSFSATDDDRKFSGLTGEEIGFKVAREILKDADRDWKPIQAIK
jgi:hypothetical protein